MDRGKVIINQKVLKYFKLEVICKHIVSNIVSTLFFKCLGS